MTAARRRSAAGPSAGPQSASVALTALVAVVLAIGAACGPSAVTPSGATSGAPSLTAAGGSAGPPASVRPSASPKADPGTAAVNAFVALVTKDGFSYQATFTGQSRHTTDILPISKGLLQVSGDSVLVKATFAWPSGNKYPVEHRYVGGKGWIKYDPTDPWRRVAIRPTETMGAFMGIRTKTDVTYLGPVKSGGTTYYQVSFRSAVVHPVMIPAINLTEATLSSPKLTLLVDATGKPVKGTAEIVGRGRISGQLQEIVIDLKLTFTKVGQAVTIKAP
jgi:hypothetical protein